MSHYASAALCSGVLFVMATVALFVGIQILRDNASSRAGRLMFGACVSVFFWNVGYAWMGLCHGDDFAYVPRAVALLSVCVYVALVLMYVTQISGYKKIPTYSVIAFVGTGYVISWLFIIGKDAVTFYDTPWGYWYKSSFTWARALQFGMIILAIMHFYWIIIFWRKKQGMRNREKHIIRQFSWFGPVLFGGYLFDTLFPMIFKTEAIPGSAVGAFASVMFLMSISNKYRTFGVTMSNVSTYVYNEVRTSIVVLDEEDQIVLYNHIAASFFGKDGETLYGKKIDEIVEPLEITSSVAEENKYRIFRVKGKNTFCSVDQTPIMDEFGDLQFTMIFAPDMTSEVASIRMLNESRRQAEEASMAKSNFLANMSHEIRTPMNAIVGMSDILLRDEKLSSEAMAQLRNIKDAGDGLLGIINDILDLSKIEAGKYELITDKYELPGLIHDVSTVINVKLQEKAVKLVVAADPSLPMYVDGDELRVRQILMNILGNALKFTHKGEIELSCHAEKEGDQYRIFYDVRDTGIGMRPEHLEHIFGEFNQVDTRKNRNTQGTGLGLAISKNLAKMMGGDITVESEYGIGSTFHVVVYQRALGEDLIGEERANALAELTYQHNKEKEAFVIQKRPDKRVLIVDDTRMNLVVAKGLMKPYEMQIDTAKSGKEAIEKVQKIDYDLVFMDHMMPEMDGVDTVHAIRALPDEKYKALTIVALSANAIAGTKEKMIEEGMQDYLAKPIDRIELNEILDRWL